MTALASFIAGPLRCFSPWALVASLVACGAADATLAVRPDPPDDAGFTSSVNTCPSFAFHLLLPRVIRAGEAATASVWAIDTDSDDTLLRYAWSATAGDF